MNKQALVEAVAAGSGDCKAAAADLVTAVFGIIAGALTQGDSVQLAGFGSFSVGERAARTGRHPATGAVIQIPAANTVKFIAGKAFREAVNGS